MKPVPLALATVLVCVAMPGVHAEVDPVTMIDQFESTFGKFDGYRRSGAKGICAEGEFVGSAAARELSTAAVFDGRPVPTIARFSVGGANPKAADNTRGQRNMALQFMAPNGEQWLMGNISSPMFGASTAGQFFGRLASLQPDPVTRAADPAKAKAFAEANPEVLLQGKYFASQPVPASFASVNYWGVHGFGFINAKGEKRLGKWVFEPVDGLESLSDEEAKARGPGFLFEDLRQRVKAGKAAFDFNLELAEAGDKVDDATQPLPAGRRKVKLGTLKLTSVSGDGGGACLTINFNPLVLPRGVEPSADPVLAARAAPYAVSQGRRLTEGARQ